MHEIPAHSVSLHTSTAPSQGRMWGRALFSSGGTCERVRDAPMSDWCCLRHFAPSCSPHSGGEHLHHLVRWCSIGWAWSSGVLPEGGGGSISPVEKKQECFCPFWCLPCCQLVPKGPLGFSFLVRACGTRRHPRAPTRLCRELQGRNKQTKKSLYHSNPSF